MQRQRHEPVAVRVRLRKLVEVFEGTWTTATLAGGTPETGVWNFVVQDGTAYGRYEGDDTGVVQGTAATTGLTLTSPAGTGTRNNDEVAGTVLVSGTTITWTGKRTL